MFYRRIGVSLVFFILFVGLIERGISDSCPDWIANRNNLPLCPISRQASILSESFPTAAVVVSSRSFDRDAQTARDLYAEQFCGENSNNRIKIPTSWLWVGHVFKRFGISR